MDVYEFLSSYFPPPMIGFFLGIGVGFCGGLIFSKGFFLYLSDGRRLKSENLLWERDREREECEKERARREAAAQRRLESMRRRAEKRDEERGAAELNRLLEDLDISPGGGFYTPKGAAEPRYCVRCLRNRHEKVPLRTSGINNACPRCGYRCISN